MNIRQGKRSARASKRRAALPFRLLLGMAVGLPLVIPLAACGPTAEQMRSQETAPAYPSGRPFQPSTPSPSPSPSPPATPRATPAAPAPSETAAPARVSVSGSQVGMPLPVQDACQFLLRRDEAPLPPAEAAACIGAAMTAGGRGTQTLQTESTWLPQGTHTVEFTTAPEFSLILVNPELKLRITAGAGGGSIDTGTGKITANASGTPEEAYAAVLADAAELTVNPERVAGLLAGMTSLEVDYGAVLNGAVRTRIGGTRSEATEEGTGADPGPSAEAGEMLPTGLTMWLDDYYRPVRLEIEGRARGITSSITAVTTGWGAPL